MEVTRRIRDYDTGEIYFTPKAQDFFSDIAKAEKVGEKTGEFLGEKIKKLFSKKKPDISAAADETKGEEIVKLLRETNSPKPTDKFQLVKDVYDELLLKYNVCFQKYERKL